MDGAAGYASPRRDGRGAIGIRQDCRLCQPPCQRGEEMAEPTEGGFVRPAWRFHPARGFVSRLGRSWGKNPSTACGGPPPFGKGGWRRRELRLRGWPFRRPRGGWRRTRPRHRSAPLAKGGRSWRSLRRGDSSALPGVFVSISVKTRRACLKKYTFSNRLFASLTLHISASFFEN